MSFIFLSRNASNFLCKLIAWLYTGSHSMFSECVHSAADTCNQLILAYGIHKSVQVNKSFTQIISGCFSKLNLFYVNYFADS